jgi:hypothetical protein
MSPKTRNIVGWVLTGIIGLILVGTGVMKIIGGEQMAAGAATMGLTVDSIRIIGCVEIFCALLFIFPRTGVLGTLLVAAYLGGAIATTLEHHLSMMLPVLLNCVVFITAAIRFPELTRRLLGTTVVV